MIKTTKKIQILKVFITVISLGIIYSPILTLNSEAKLSTKTSPKVVTETKFDAIKQKMTYEQVSEILGFTGEVIKLYINTEDTKEYVWNSENVPYASIQVEFKNNAATRKTFDSSRGFEQNVVATDWTFFDKIIIGKPISYLEEIIGTQLNAKIKNVVFNKPVTTRIYLKSNNLPGYFLYDILLRDNIIENVVIHALLNSRLGVKKISRDLFRQIQINTHLKDIYTVLGPGEPTIKFESNHEDKVVIISAYRRPLTGSDKAFVDLLFQDNILIVKKIIE